MQIEICPISISSLLNLMTMSMCYMLCSTLKQFSPNLNSVNLSIPVLRVNNKGHLHAGEGIRQKGDKNRQGKGFLAYVDVCNVDCCAKTGMIVRDELFLVWCWLTAVVACGCWLNYLIQVGWWRELGGSFGPSVTVSGVTFGPRDTALHISCTFSPTGLTLLMFLFFSGMSVYLWFCVLGF